MLSGVPGQGDKDGEGGGVGGWRLYRKQSRR
jgi:hypothetical protein